MFEQGVIFITKLLEFIGVSVIVIGALCSTVVFLKDLSRKNDCAYETLRRTLGRSILLGLEFLVAADIINTVGVEPTMGSVLVLGVIVIIRTFLSFSIEAEIEKKLPWQDKKTL